MLPQAVRPRNQESVEEMLRKEKERERKTKEDYYSQLCTHINEFRLTLKLLKEKLHQFPNVGGENQEDIQDYLLPRDLLDKLERFNCNPAIYLFEEIENSIERVRSNDMKNETIQNCMDSISTTIAEVDQERKI